MLYISANSSKCFKRSWITLRLNKKNTLTFVWSLWNMLLTITFDCETKTFERNAIKNLNENNLNCSRFSIKWTSKFTNSFCRRDDEFITYFMFFCSNLLRKKKVFIHSAKFSYEFDDIEMKQNDENEYFVHKLVDFKIFDANKCFDYFDDEYDFYYRVYWQNYDEDEKTWKSIEHVKHLKNLLRIFHRTNFNKSDAN